jgi:hypothetical protein
VSRVRRVAIPQLLRLRRISLYRLHHISLHRMISIQESTEQLWRRTHSVGGLRNHQSITPENAANAAPPPSMAPGPECLARTAPARKPPETALVMSFFARYYRSSSIIRPLVQR